MRALPLIGILLAACGGSASLGVPTSHRATALACSGDRPAGNCDGTIGGTAPNCSADSDCTAGSQGRCFHYHNAQCLCNYDTCSSDADCPTGQLCGCHGTFGIDDTQPDSCMPGNCRTDADCGTAGYCSPSLDLGCGAYAGVTGFYCHTSHDECSNDSDCKTASGNVAATFCGYNAEVAHWTCVTAICAG